MRTWWRFSQNRRFSTSSPALGTYLTPEDYAFEFLLKDNGRLYLRRSGRGDVELEPKSANVFRQRYDPAFRQEFGVDAAGAATVTAYHTSHAPYTLVRPAADWTGVDESRLTGTYVNRETGVALAITSRGGRSYAIDYGNDEPSAGSLVTPGKLLFDGYVLTYAPDAGPVKELRLAGGRLRELRFVRTP